MGVSDFYSFNRLSFAKKQYEHMNNFKSLKEYICLVNTNRKAIWERDMIHEKE